GMLGASPDLARVRRDLGSERLAAGGKETHRPRFRADREDFALAVGGAQSHDGPRSLEFAESLQPWRREDHQPVAPGGLGAGGQDGASGKGTGQEEAGVASRAQLVDAGKDFGGIGQRAGFQYGSPAMPDRSRLREHR